MHVRAAGPIAPGFAAGRGPRRRQACGILSIPVAGMDGDAPCATFPVVKGVFSCISHVLLQFFGLNVFVFEPKI